jgi:hypothetical protein
MMMAASKVKIKTTKVSLAEPADNSQYWGS